VRDLRDFMNRANIQIGKKMRAKVVRIQPDDGSKRLVGIHVMPKFVDEVGAHVLPLMRRFFHVRWVRFRGNCLCGILLSAST